MGASVFQFHKGTIKPLHGHKISSLHLEFQFHKGTIKPKPAQHLNQTKSSFNSIKVRLNPAPMVDIDEYIDVSIP